MAPASAKTTETNSIISSQSQCEFTALSVSGGDCWGLSVLFYGLVTSRSNNTFNTGPMEATVNPLLHYEILQFPLEDDDEFFGGLWGGLKDFERFRLLALLPPLLPLAAALFATE